MIPSTLPPPIPPEEYERAVKTILDAAGSDLVEYESIHLQKIKGVDGEYVIDVVARFAALGAKFTVLVECKHESRRTERHDLQALLQKLQSTGSQKAMVFSIAGFQSGALEFARVHGIATVQFAQGITTWHTRRAGPTLPPPSFVKLPAWVGLWMHGNQISILSEDRPQYTREALGLPESD